MVRSPVPGLGTSYRFSVICRPGLIPQGTRVINNLQIGRALIGEMALEAPIKSMMCWNSNPVTQAPETDKIVKGLKREDLFLVSAEHFISDTASYADIVLPATMGAEMEDMTLSWGHLYLTYNAKCVESRPARPFRTTRSFAVSLLGSATRKKISSGRTPNASSTTSTGNRRPVRASISAYLRKHGFARLRVGTKDDRGPTSRGQLPDADRQMPFPRRKRYELRCWSIPADVRRLPGRVRRLIHCPITSRRAKRGPTTLSWQRDRLTLSLRRATGF